jgi:poly(3-hydroxybutyrate) depolymerase
VRALIPALSLLILPGFISAAAPDAEASARAVQELHKVLKSPPGSLSDILSHDWTATALTKSDAAKARKAILEAHAAMIRQDRAAEINSRILKDGNREMPFFSKTFGEKPAGGRSLWISMHGGGNAAARVNDRQYENQKRLYTLSEGIYLAPRAPTNTWNLWHEPHIDRLFTRLIEDLIVLEEVNPDRVYVLGYSAGGDGVYQIGPRMADSWAAAAMMAGHPNGVSLLSLRNCPFSIQVGGNDAAYGRNRVAKEYGDQLDKLQKDDPFGYIHAVRIHEGKPHWMGGEDKAALPWMALFTRNPIPERVVWKQTSVPHTRFYWLGVPDAEARKDTLIIAERRGATVELVNVEGAKSLLIRFDDRMTDLDQPVTVRHSGKDLFKGTATRTIGTMLRTLADRGDPRLLFDAEIAVTP